MDELTHEIRLLRLLVVASILFSLSLGGAIIWLMAGRNSADHLTLHRLDIVDADGKLRLAISNKQELPDLLIDGKPVPRSGKDAGMIFFNDESFESGGLLVSGGKTAPEVQQGLSLTFDQYHGDQNLQLLYEQSGTKKTAGLIVNDRPDEDIADVFHEFSDVKAMPDSAEKKARMRTLLEKNPRRAFFGKRDGLPGIWLTDSQGKERLRLYIDDSGDPHIELLDKDGKVSYRLPE